MDRRSFLQTTGLTALGLTSLAGRATRGAESQGKKVLLFTRSAGFQHSVVTRKGNELAHAERIFQDLAAARDFEAVITKDGTVFDGDLDQFDAFLFYTTGDLTSPRSADGAPPMSPEGKQRLLDAVAGGKGFVGSHCASDTFHTPGPARERQLNPDPYIAMLGGEFISHGAQQPARMVVASPTFPGMEKIQSSFEMNEEWYSLKNLAEDMHVILVQDTQGMKGNDYERPRYPATWARHHGQGRVFYTSMGHREDVWSNPTFQQILLGGLSWAAGWTNAEIPTNFAEVTPGGQVMPGQQVSSS